MNFQRPLVVAAILLLGGCSAGATAPNGSYAPALVTPGTRTPIAHASALNELDSLSYSDGSITVFHISNGRAHVYRQFRPGNGGAQGLAVDANGLIYTAINSSSAKPCLACVVVFTPAGQTIAQLPAPILPGAPNPPSITDVALDAAGNVYASDYGQQAVYFFPPIQAVGAAPTVVVQNSQNAASVLSAPDGDDVFVSGGCGFGEARPYVRVRGKPYQSGSCFGIGTVALIGGASDDDLDVMTPVDGVPGLVSVSSPSGNGNIFHTPDQRFASISGVSLTGDGAVAYVADAHKQWVYAFARPANGWINGGQPKVTATYKGFKNLDIIAVRP